MFKFFLEELKKRNNGIFWVTSVSQLLLAIQLVLAIFGQQELLNQALQHNILAAVEGIITLLGTIGVFINPLSAEFKKGGLDNSLPPSAVSEPVATKHSDKELAGFTIIESNLFTGHYGVVNESTNSPDKLYLTNELPTVPFEPVVDEQSDVKPIQGPIVTTDQQDENKQ
jgi:uncharacterized membrane protein